MICLGLEPKATIDKVWRDFANMDFIGFPYTIYAFDMDLI